MDTPQMHCDEPSAAPAVPAASDASKACKTCQGLFRTRRRWQEFCSNRCRNEWHGKFARVARIKEAAPRMYEALVKIASFREGAEVSGSFDEPHAAAIAREAIKDLKAP